MNKGLNYELKPLWHKYFNFNWKFGLFLILIISIPRFILVLNANEIANYSYIGLIMIVSAIIPFLFLTRYGLKVIGLTKPRKYLWLVAALGIGFVFSLILYFIGDLLYANSYENWYVYIGKSYNIPLEINTSEKLTLFLIMSLSGMIFSPIGEEFFFRGIVHSSFAKSVGDVKASIIDSTAFALVHISHFGLVFINSEWTFFFIPALLWVVSMFFLGILLFICRYISGSLWSAVLCHSGFNLGMIYCIFYLIN